MPRVARVRVFEVDLPRTQARKRRLLDELYDRLPPNVTFVGVDFERDALESRLREAGFDPTRKTLYSWEGVSFYLHRPAVEQVLKTLAGLSPGGGSLVFDYSLRSFTERRDLRTYGGAKLMHWLDTHGVPYHFGAEAPEMASILGAAGFEVLADIGPAELEGYLVGARGRSTWRVWGNFRVAHARLVARLGA
jgi:methyltransferase (TIGR00027 family)